VVGRMGDVKLAPGALVRNWIPSTIQGYGSHSRFSLRAVSADRSFLTSERCPEDRRFPRLTSQNAFLDNFRVARPSGHYRFRNLSH
jgi:hypothetical protein